MVFNCGPMHYVLTLILNALLNPLAKNPPNGPMTEAKIDMKKQWMKNGYTVTVAFMFN